MYIRFAEPTVRVRREAIAVLDAAALRAGGESESERKRRLRDVVLRGDSTLLDELVRQYSREPTQDVFVLACKRLADDGLDVIEAVLETWIELAQGNVATADDRPDANGSSPVRQLARVAIEAARKNPSRTVARALRVSQTLYEKLHPDKYNLACMLSMRSALKAQGFDDAEGGADNDTSQSLQSKAFEALESSIEAGFTHVDHMRSDPDLAPIRDNPRFDELCLKARVDWANKFIAGPLLSQNESRGTVLRLQIAEMLLSESGEVVRRRPTEVADRALRLACTLYKEIPAVQVDQFGRDTILYNTACTLALRCELKRTGIVSADGESDQQTADDLQNLAIEALQSAIEAGFSDLKLLDSDPDLNTIRTDPRFEAVKLKAASK
jgi:hypothetical protein